MGSVWQVALWTCCLLSSLALARESAPRVLSPTHADAYSMKTFAQFARWKDLKGEAKVYEIYKYLADKRTGLYPMGAGAFEGKDPLYEFGFIRDPVKMINVYSLGYCDMLGPTMEGVMRDAGIGKARTVTLPGLSHVLCEVNTGERWHYLDLDLRAVFRREDGTLGSMEEAKTDDSLWKTPRGPLFFPLDNVANMRKQYATAKVEYRYGVNMGGHTIDFVLRRGESFTRWWKPQGGRWHNHETYNKGPQRDILEREPRGPKCKHAGEVFTIHTHGNGRFIYKPNLTNKSGDFADGVFSSENVQASSDGLTLKAAGEGSAVFEVRSPYVIAPLVGDPEKLDDDKEASVVSLDAAGVSLALSLDNGLTWTDVALANGKVDLTPHVSGRYGYLLKLKFSGEPAKSIVKALEITTWVQLHPAALPTLQKGKNEMQYVTGDHHGLASRVLEIRPNGADKEDFLKYCAEPPKDFDPKRVTARAIGPFTVKVAAPAGSKIAWFSGGGSFCAHQGGNAPKTANSMAYAVNEPKDFKQFYKADVPVGQSHWHYNADVEVKLEQPANTVYLQYVGDPGVNNLRIYAHYIDDTPPASAPMNITHTWTENGAEKSKTVTLEKSGPYEITTEADPVNVSIEMAIPSSAK
ncbi:MAG TPA: hypothetical protein VEJ63_01700 [Planctomycetota bacterium]|nr:hypothetical protein [Planctomycetota bacterium]